MGNRMLQLILLAWCATLSLTSAYPVESKPLNNNPESWNFGDGWLYFNPRNSADPSASALIGGDPHVKKSKITPKSIFIAPSSYTGNEQLCPHGFRVDDNGKCIKTVTINQDEILAARISELFGIDESPNKNSDIDSDYYDFDDESKSEKDSGPLQINLPLALDMDMDDDDDEGKKVEYVVERFSVRNFDPQLISTTTERIELSTAPVTETTESVPTEEPSTSSTPSPTEADDESGATVTESMLPISSTVKDDDDEIAFSTLPPTTVEPITAPSTTTTLEPSTTTSTTTTSTATPVVPVKIFSVDFLPKSQRKSNRMGQASARLKNSRDRDKVDRPRKQKTTVASVSSSEVATKLYKLEKDQVPKKNRTRSKRRKLTTTTTELITESPVTTTQKPFWWLPKGWSIDESKEKPVLVRFWSQQPLKQDERARSHSTSSRQQRVNSRMPSDNIFREVTAPEFESLMKK